MPEEAEANAYLIAAAPELLAACKIAYAAWCDGTDAADWDALALRDAIAKAERLHSLMKMNNPSSFHSSGTSNEHSIYRSQNHRLMSSNTQGS